MGLSVEEARAAARRCRELLDVDALVSAFMGEVNSFGPASAPNSLPNLFLSWASERLGAHAHIVFDEATLMDVRVERPLALAVLEDIFVGQPLPSRDETYRGEPLLARFIATSP